MTNYALRYLDDNNSGWSHEPFFPDDRFMEMLGEVHILYEEHMSKGRRCRVTARRKESELYVVAWRDEVILMGEATEVLKLEKQILQTWPNLVTQGAQDCLTHQALDEASKE